MRNKQQRQDLIASLAMALFTALALYAFAVLA